MKFSVKITLCVLVILALFLSLNSAQMIERSFSSSLAEAAHQYSDAHLKDKFQIESAAARLAAQNEFTQLQASLRTAADQVVRQHASQNQTMAVYAEGVSIYTTLPRAISYGQQLALLEMAHTEYRVIEAGGDYYMVMVSPLIVHAGDARLMSVYRVSGIFDMRAGMIQNQLRMSMLSLLVAAAVVSVMALLLTRPLKEMADISEHIAAGQYDRRTDIHSGDEVGALSRSFDKMADAVESQIDRLNESVRNRDDFVSAFTHEIKTPMTAMLGYAAHLRMSRQSREQQKKAADYIYFETRRLEELSIKLMQLMGLTRQDKAFEWVEVPALFTEIERAWAREDVQVSLAFDCAPGICVLGDAVLLDDLMRNLISNAARACRHADGHITVRCFMRAKQAVFTVSDNGIGIPPDELDRITEPFYMVDKSRSRSENGSGMGLALGAKIAELHGTALRFDSVPDVGTTVTFELPARDCSEEDNHA